MYYLNWGGKYAKNLKERGFFVSNHIRLTSSEVSTLWSGYMNDSMAVLVLNYFLSNVEDKDIKGVIEMALAQSQRHLEVMNQIFKEEDFPVPHGFKEEEDLDLTAPKLFSDIYMLQFVNQLGKIGSMGYSIGVGLSTRADIFEFYRECMNESMELIKYSNDVLLSKGLYIRPPFIEVPEKVEFVQKQSFLAGWFGEKRSLAAMEISNMFFNFQRNALGVATLIGFSQVAKDPEVQEFFFRGKDIANKHIEIFRGVMREDDLPVPLTWDTEVTSSTVSPFSDKLMMFQITALIALGIGFYGTSMSVSPRRDLVALYGRLMIEIGKYSEDGANIMIDRGWLEKPPLTVNRNEIMNKKS